MLLDFTDCTKTGISKLITCCALKCLLYDVFLLFHRLDQRGQITRLNYNNQVRDSVLAVKSARDVKAIYKGFKLLDSLAYDQANMINYKLKEGMQGYLIII